MEVSTDETCEDQDWDFIETDISMFWKCQYFLVMLIYACQDLVSTDETCENQDWDLTETYWSIFWKYQKNWFVNIHLSRLILNSQDLVSTFETKAKRPTCKPLFSTCQDSLEKSISTCQLIIDIFKISTSWSRSNLGLNISQLLIKKYWQALIKMSIKYWHFQNINTLVLVKCQTTYLSNWVQSLDKRSSTC